VRCPHFSDDPTAYIPLFFSEISSRVPLFDFYLAVLMYKSVKSVKVVF
jgi:hypothetical protein